MHEPGTLSASAHADPGKAPGSRPAHKPRIHNRTPTGDPPVALGSSVGRQTGFALHGTGTHTQAHEAELGKAPARKEARKPSIDDPLQGGAHA